MTIVYFHNVQGQPCDAFDERLSRLHVDEFRACVDNLCSRFHTMSLEAYLENHRRGTPDRKALALTFDDGYRGVYDHALPILHERQMPATVFIMDADTDEAYRPLHFEQIEGAFRTTTRLQIALDFLGLETMGWSTDAERLDCMKRIKRALKGASEAQRAEAHAKLLAALGVDEEQLAADPLLGQRNAKLRAAELDELRSEGWSIGAHTRTHRTLSKLDDAEKRTEIQAPLARIRQRFDVEAVPFAYPYGGEAHIDSACRDYAEAAGYSCALTTILGWNHLQTDRFWLHRLEYPQLMRFLRG